MFTKVVTVSLLFWSLAASAADPIWGANPDISKHVTFADAHEAVAAWVPRHFKGFQNIAGLPNYSPHFAGYYKVLHHTAALATDVPSFAKFFKDSSLLRLIPWGAGLSYGISSHQNTYYEIVYPGSEYRLERTKAVDTFFARVKANLTRAEIQQMLELHTYESDEYTLAAQNPFIDAFFSAEKPAPTLTEVNALLKSDYLGPWVDQLVRDKAEEAGLSKGRLVHRRSVWRLLRGCWDMLKYFPIGR